MLQGPIGKEVQKCVMVFCQQLGCEIVELSIQVDHVHLLLKVPPKLSISELMGVLKGRTAIRLFNEFPTLRKKPYWGNHFWAAYPSFLSWVARVRTRPRSFTGVLTRLP